MRIELFNKEGKFYKANTHTHSTVSDGKMSPAEIKESYMEKGYSIVAFTDHEIIVPHNELSDENFLAITGMEMYANTSGWDYSFVRTYHLCFLAKDKNNVACPAFAAKYVERPCSQEYITEEMCVYDYTRDYDVDFVNKIIKESNEKGFLVTYNHPFWSLQNYKDYGKLEGLWGVEVYNNASTVEGYSDTAQAFYDMLSDEKDVFPIASDDVHSASSAFGGYLWVKSPNLEYNSVMTALENGEFYASCGPEIIDAYIEDEKLFVECKNACEVVVNTERRYAFSKKSDEDCFVAEIDLKAYLESTRKFKEKLSKKPFVRITLKDREGKKAYTRAFYLERLGIL